MLVKKILGPKGLPRGWDKIIVMGKKKLRGKKNVGDGSRGEGNGVCVKFDTSSRVLALFSKFGNPKLRIIGGNSEGFATYIRLEKTKITELKTDILLNCYTLQL